MEESRVPLDRESLRILLEAARRQFSKDLPDLLESDRGRWVAYHGERQLSVDYSEFEAAKSAAASEFPREEVRSFWIMTGEDLIEEADAA